jgi:hypothetical protein
VEFFLHSPIHLLGVVLARVQNIHVILMISRYRIHEHMHGIFLPENRCPVEIKEMRNKMYDG